MTEDVRRDTEPAPPRAASDRLDSWKEIGAYLKRDVTTVRRWEKREGLPVHRHLHERRDSVYAFTAEIDAWWHGRRNGLGENEAADTGETLPPPEPPPASSPVQLTSWWFRSGVAVSTTIPGWS